MRTAVPVLVHGVAAASTTAYATAATLSVSQRTEEGRAGPRPARVKFQRSESPEARRSIRCSCMEIATTTRPSGPPSAYVLADKRVRGCLLLAAVRHLFCSAHTHTPLFPLSSFLFPRSPFRLFPHPIGDDDDDEYNCRVQTRAQAPILPYPWAAKTGVATTVSFMETKGPVESLIQKPNHSGLLA